MIVRRLLKPLASLRLTVTLLAMSMLVILAGTLAQRYLDIWAVQKAYFHSFFVWIPFQLFFPRPEDGEFGIPGRLPMLGGYSLCGLLLINLLAAHTVRFKFTRKRVGIILIHFGIILLLVGELLTNATATEGQMTIREGTSERFVEDSRVAELAVIDPSPSDHDNVTVIPVSRLHSGTTITDPRLPFEIHIDDYWRNSTLSGDAMNPTFVQAAPADGFSESPEFPFARVTLVKQDQKLGTYQLPSMPLRWLMPIAAHLSEPQVVRVDGKEYRIALRFKRTYKPYTVQLLKFTHDTYTGSDTPKNFASRIVLNDPSRHEQREVLIWMNHPLRYNGETFYQSAYRGEHVTVLQVVQNPSWLLPYFACAIGGLGLVIHFGAMLLAFLRRKLASPIIFPSPGMPGEGRGDGAGLRPLLVPVLATACVAFYLASLFIPPTASADSFDLQSFGQLPISFEGRTMPLDSLARNTLRIINGRDSFTSDGRTLPAVQWLIDVMAGRPSAKDYRVFRIDHPDILSFLNLDGSRIRFSLGDLQPNFQKLDEQIQSARAVGTHERSLYQRKIYELGEHLMLADRMFSLESLYLAPPSAPNMDWQTVALAVDESKKTGAMNQGLRQFVTILDAYSNNRPEEFNRLVSSYQHYLESHVPTQEHKAEFESLLNRVDPFYNAMILYTVIFILICVSWLVWGPTLSRTAYWLLIVTFLLHVFGLVARIIISGRPPVTNLYSSAIFIPCAGVLFCIVMEKLFRNGIPTAATSLMGFTSLIVAQYLASSPTVTPNGDTMRLLQAVLDTNIWLATHVVVITLGYSSTFLAGILAMAYIVLGVFTPALREKTVPVPVFAPGKKTGAGTVFSSSESQGRTLTRMVYGIVCFAVLFSFIGTILGGIWADQSWGRFWGWDPKENGAILLVLWNAIILHARWAGMVRERGLMNLAVFGNIVTSWSWFGTNMLGVGLHSYGFMDSAAFWLSAFIVSQLALIGVGLIPLDKWRSFSTKPSQPAFAEAIVK